MMVLWNAKNYVATISARGGEGQLLLSNNFNDAGIFPYIKVVWRGMGCWLEIGLPGCANSRRSITLKLHAGRQGANWLLMARVFENLLEIRAWVISREDREEWLGLDFGRDKKESCF